MEELAIKGLDENGKCIITSFSIIRKGYGQIFFEGPLDVSNLNLDEIGKSSDHTHSWKVVNNCLILLFSVVPS